MFAETVIDTLLGASITGAGLILAAYALITPIFEKLFIDRISRIDEASKEYKTRREEFKKLNDPNQKFAGLLVLAVLSEEIGINKNFCVNFHSSLSF